MNKNLYKKTRKAFAFQSLNFDFYQRIMSQNIFNDILKFQRKENKDNNFIKKILIFLIHVFLSINSLFSIAFYFFSARKYAHYMVESRGKIDRRSILFHSIVANKKFIYFVHSNNPLTSILNIFSFRFIHLESLSRFFYFIFFIYLYFFRNIDTKKHNYFSNYGLIYFYTTLHIFKFLKISKILMVDDPRNAAIFSSVSKKLAIETVAYQHGKVNCNTVGLQVFQFDYYFVWNNYYREMYQSFWDYQTSKIIISGIPKLNFPVTSCFKMAGQRNLLWLEEDRVPLSFYYKYIDILLKNKINVYLKLKPRDTQVIKIESRFQNRISEIGDLGECIKAYKIKFVVGTHSTALVESISYGAIPISFLPFNDYSNDLFDAGFIKVFYSIKQLINFVETPSLHHHKKFAGKFKLQSVKKILARLFN